MWCAEIRGKTGAAGFHLARRPSLVASTLVGCVAGMGGYQLMQLLGAWLFAMASRKETISILDVAFVSVRTLPLHKQLSISGPLLND